MWKSSSTCIKMASAPRHHECITTAVATVTSDVDGSARLLHLANWRLVDGRLLELLAEGRIVTGSNVDLAGALAAGEACRRARNRTRRLRIFVQRQPVGTPSFGCCCKIARLLKNSFHEIRRNKVASGCPINDVPIFLDIFYPPNFRCFEESRVLNSHSPITFIDRVLGIVV
jgi:hypothetical protein